MSESLQVGKLYRPTSASIDKLTELLRKTSGKGPVGNCEPDPEPLAHVDGVFVGEVQVVGDKSFQSYVTVVRTDKGNVMIPGLPHSPVPAKYANRIYERSDQWHLTHTINEEDKRKKSKLNATKS